MYRWDFSHFYRDDNFRRAVSSFLNPGYLVEDGITALQNAFRVLDEQDYSSLALQISFNFDPHLELHNPKHIRYICWKLSVGNLSLEEFAAQEGVNPASLWKRGSAAMKLFFRVYLSCLRTQLRNERYAIVLNQLNATFKIVSWDVKKSESHTQ